MDPQKLFLCYHIHGHYGFGKNRILTCNKSYINCIIIIILSPYLVTEKY